MGYYLIIKDATEVATIKIERHIPLSYISTKSFTTLLDEEGPFHCPFSHTSTILEHWVPLPAPGPPSTNTTCGFITSDTRYSKLGTFCDKLPNKRPIIN